MQKAWFDWRGQGHRNSSSCPTQTRRFPLHGASYHLPAQGTDHASDNACQGSSTRSNTLLRNHHQSLLWLPKVILWQDRFLHAQEGFLLDCVHTLLNLSPIRVRKVRLTQGDTNDKGYCTYKVDKNGTNNGNTGAKRHVAIIRRHV